MMKKGNPSCGSPSCQLPAIDNSPPRALMKYWVFRSLRRATAARGGSDKLLKKLDQNFSAAARLRVQTGRYVGSDLFFPQKVINTIGYAQGIGRGLKNRNQKPFRKFLKRVWGKLFPKSFPHQNPILSQKTVDDFFFRLFFGKSKGHQLDQLLARDFSDCRLVNQRRVGMHRHDLGNRDDRGSIHNNGIAFGVTRAGGVALDTETNF